ncbi:tRNA (guanosine(46)-N7)-methyltransferase TrmB [Merismopedia glauca]|uniref:tRNA (guanine-N(7)-)-methyltransferase n=1 Tax=Merismopedia glauca CCAP 1448/3 TaxID=1296344 RepID=A0A2T1C8Y1_9CYAN|nr:tRNA (guanosine(46)-N7)-methyltransferase TrmB [Merismopedia glauca]PSB04618.1 tRNA (guanosine(46)-N7)-methyltransferase TrmB [Merismopedia glauca CCAP 1448/3]
MVKVRVRQHVNPLSYKYRSLTPLPDWRSLYSNLDLPLHIDIGCARGSFIQQMAVQTPDWNFLGLEIREALVEEANHQRDELGLTNLHYLFTNANVSLSALLASLPAGILKRVSIQFPDPWFKKRHMKRRVVQPELVEAIANYLAPCGEVFLQSDVEEVAREMRDRFSENPAFQINSTAWLATNPLPVPTEREIATLNRGLPVYRCVFKGIRKREAGRRKKEA